MDNVIFEAYMMDTLRTCIKSNYEYADGLIFILDRNNQTQENLLYEVLDNSVYEYSFIKVNFNDEEDEDSGSITFEEAKQIVEYVDNTMQKLSDKETIMFHIGCKGGVSRSASVCMFFDYVINHSVVKFYDTHFTPNKKVLNTLISAWTDRFNDCDLTESIVNNLCEKSFEIWKREFEKENK